MVEVNTKLVSSHKEPAFARSSFCALAHEAFHYLRKTRQVEGRHGEIEADAFALKTLEHYRDGSNSTKAPTRGRR
jgi:hypothetical protein